MVRRDCSASRIEQLHHLIMPYCAAVGGRSSSKFICGFAYAQMPEVGEVGFVCFWQLFGVRFT